ncbi:DEAD/DEAH box helicase family protein [Bacillus sp. AGMB 02131]|uniref:DEAD/DEAH box helicase family protein n=1 Tax=Peribacillus faecalis TaxID=2772559 RepID=A0A927CVJ0_9BACI|nr:DEAD/DEAH box helicase family protein [Peribacillus faecalis]MBD3107929.1 DEAD/DEAH box helicase family protein [Peribacillus faecalis]
MSSPVQLITHDLLAKLEESIREAKSCYILTSFVMDSGVKLLEPLLKEAAERGAEIKVVTGDYLYITQPKALERLLLIHPSIELRLWRSEGISFHPKAYIFENEDDGRFIIGSSNLSKSALTAGVEWNISMQESVEESVYEQVVSEFLKVFYHDSTVSLNPETLKQYKFKYDSFHQKNPNLARTWTKREELEMTLPVEQVQPEEVADPPAPYTFISPRFAQIDALAELENSREEGYDKAMVVMATGLGKTYLAAFFAKHFKRILFIAHLEEILHQAESSFKRVISDKTTGIYNGKQKNPDAEVIFASIQTLSRKRHLEIFDPEDFDLIIVDEFHHAAANTYQKVLHYFRPQFLLGITATPDRNDYRDIYAICDGNVAYRIDFIEAIQKQWLSPFHYYGVYDDTDYSQIRWLGQRYDAEELAIAQLKDSVAQTIFNAWLKHRQTRTIVFCSSIVQADFLASYFKKHGVEAVSLHSKSNIARNKAIGQLADGTLDCIMTVDLFNEGVDIPTVDTLLFARPTESLTVFTQQIGRGLRLAEGKTHCVIIDLIANYRNADIKQSMFYLPETKKKKVGSKPILPEGCVVELDVEAKQLIEELSKKRKPRKEMLKNSYEQVKRELGRRPTYLEMHMRGSEDSLMFKQEFKSYFAFLLWAGELTDKEQEVFQRYDEWFYEVERTGMTKSYKMVLLLAMLERGADNWMKPISDTEAASFFHQYLMEKDYRKKIDFSDKSSQALWDYNEKKVANKIRTMPMEKWSGDSKGLVGLENGVFSVLFDVTEEDKAILFDFTKQICEFRLHWFFERKKY